MSTVGLQTPETAYHPLCMEAAWYAAQTRSRHERIAEFHLAMHGIVQYLPTITETHIWSDRRKKIERPLFPGYIFVQILPTDESRIEVLRIPGVVRLVGSEPRGTPIPAAQIESVRTLVNRKLPWSSHPFLKAGQRVRVRGGALDGIEGLFVKQNGEDTLVITVDAIQRSLCVSIHGYAIEAL